MESARSDDVARIERDQWLPLIITNTQGLNTTVLYIKMALARSSRVEDYYRQHNVEGLFKDMTHMLVQKMPPDPAVALVQFLQKKFPRSFRTPVDSTNNGVGIVSKSTTNSLQLQSMTSPRSDINMESTTGGRLRRRSSDQSQVSGIATLPTAASIFADTLKQDIASIRQQPQQQEQRPELTFKNLLFADRLGQRVFKMGKDIQSDRDILEEELLKPEKKGKVSPTSTEPTDAISSNIQQEQTHEQPSVKQLIKYKQQLRIEHDLRVHKDKLFQLAEQERLKTEKFLAPTITTQPIPDQQNGDMSSQIVPQTGSHKGATKPTVQSKEEEEILADEDVFGAKKRRHIGRHQKKTTTSRSNIPYGHGRYTGTGQAPMHRGRSQIPTLNFDVCKMCGQVMNGGDRHPTFDSQQTSAHPTARSFEPQASTRSIETAGGIVDDWFESASDVSGPRQVTPWTVDNPTPPPTGSNTFRRSLFQPFNTDSTDTMEHHPQPLIIADDETTNKRSTTPRMSGSGTFSRSPEPKIRRSSSSRSVPSSVTKKQQPNSVVNRTEQTTKTMPRSSPSQPVRPSTLSAPMDSTTGRRMSGWGVREHSPDDSDDN